MSKTKPPKPAAVQPAPVKPATPMESAAPAAPPEPTANDTSDQVLAASSSPPCQGLPTEVEPPVVEPQPLAADLGGDPPHQPEPEYPPVAPVFRIEDARALPEITGSVFVPHRCEDERAISAFKEEDGRTMQVCVTVEGLAKIQLEGAPA